MAVRYARTTLAAPTSGTLPVAQTFPFSLGGLTPVGAIFRTSSGTVLGTAVAPARRSVGFVAGGVSRCVSMMSENGTAFGSTDAGWGYSAADVVRLLATTNDAEEARASFVSFDADEVNVQWDVLPLTAVQVECEVVYGDDAEAEVFEFAAALVVGEDVEVPLSFLFGQLHLASVYATAAVRSNGGDGVLALGYCTQEDGVLRQACGTYYERERATVQTRVGQSLQTGICLERFTVSVAGAVTQGPRLEVVAADAAGFTVRTLTAVDTLNAIGLAVRTNRQRVWAGIALEVEPPSGPPTGQLQTQTTGTHLVQDPGFPADEVWCLASGLSVSGDPGAPPFVGAIAGRFSEGGGNADATLAATIQVQGNAGTSNTRSALSARLARVILNDGTDDWAADLVLGTEPLGFGVDVVDASSVARECAFMALSLETREVPTPVALPLVLPAPLVRQTQDPPALPLPLALPLPQVLATETPGAVELGLVLPAPLLLATETPGPLPIVLVLPAPSILVELDPGPLVLGLLLPAPEVLATETPGPLLVALVLPAPQVVFPDAENPPPIVLALSLPAPALLVVLDPPPLVLALVLPDVAVLGVLTPPPVVLALLLPAPRVGMLLVGLELEVEVTRSLPLDGLLGRGVELETPTARGLALSVGVE